jgi:hypothetical protein
MKLQFHSLGGGGSANKIGGKETRPKESAMGKIRSVSRRAAGLASMGILACAASAAFAAPAEAAPILPGPRCVAPFFCGERGDTTDICCGTEPGFYCPLHTVLCRKPGPIEADPQPIVVTEQGGSGAVVR